MKKLLLAVMLLASSAVVFADHLSSKFVLKIANYGVYTVLFDNEVFHTTSGVDVLNVSPGEHFVRITENVRSAYRANARGSKLVYEGYVHVPRQSRVVARVNAHNFFNIQNVVPLRANYRGSTCGVDHYGADCRSVHAIPPRGRVDFYTNFSVGFRGCADDARRLAYARAHLRGNRISSAQARELAIMFRSDRCRADFLRMAYPCVSDRANYRRTVDCVRDVNYRRGLYVSLRI